MDKGAVNPPPSREDRALRKCAAKFRTGVDPNFIVPRLYEELLLTREEKNSANQKTLTDDERLDVVWQALERRVAVDPSDFHSVVEILHNELPMKKLGDHMQGVS